MTSRKNIDSLIESLSILQLNNNNNMATPRVLSIDPLKYLERVPEFNGKFGTLQNFINLIERITPLIIQYDEFSKGILSDIIKSKLTGKAREVIEINNHVQSWEDIKVVLNNNFGDRLSVEQLFDELRSQTFKTNAVDFYNDIKNILRRLNMKTEQDLQNDNINLKRYLDANINSALNVFKNKVPEPLKSILSCRNPTSLENAMKILHESGYAFFNNSKHNNMPNHRNNNNNNNNNYSNKNNRIQLHKNSQNSNRNNNNANSYRNSSNDSNSNNRYPYNKINHNSSLLNSNKNSNFYRNNNNNNFLNSTNHNYHPNSNNSYNNFRTNNNWQQNQRHNLEYNQNLHNNKNNQSQIEPMDINNQQVIEVGNFRETGQTDFPT